MVHVAGVCIDFTDPPNVKALIAKRSNLRRLFPKKWEGCGGRVLQDETFPGALRRHFKEEMGIDIEVDTKSCIAIYEIRTPEIIIPGVRLFCRQTCDRRPHSCNHTEVKWVTEEELKQMPSEDFVGDLKADILHYFDLNKEYWGY